MLAQLVDLEARLVTLGRTPPDILDADERASTWLGDKAFRRVWHATSLRQTEAMLQTPRRVLEARALSGNWPAFPVSPCSYFAPLQALYRFGYFDYRGVGLIVMQLDFNVNQMFAAASHDDVRLAVRRASLSACIEAMEHVDDSGAELAEHFREQERAYLDQVVCYLQHPGFLRDLLELATWEDYGLFHHIDGFLVELPEPIMDLAVRELARIIADHRGTTRREFGLSAGQSPASAQCRPPRCRALPFNLARMNGCIAQTWQTTVLWRLGRESTT